MTKILDSQAFDWRRPMEVGSPEDFGVAILAVDLEERDLDRETLGALNLGEKWSSALLRGGMLQHRESGKLTRSISRNGRLIFADLDPGNHDLVAVWTNRNDPKENKSEAEARFAHPWGENHTVGECILLVELEGSQFAELDSLSFEIEPGRIEHCGTLTLKIVNEEPPYDVGNFAVSGRDYPEVEAHLSKASLKEVEFDPTPTEKSEEIELFKRWITGPHAERWRAIADAR